MGVTEKATRKKCKVRFSLIKKNKVFQKSYMKVEGQEVSTSGYGTSENVESACSRNCTHRKIKIEEADGSSSGQTEHDIVVFVHGSIWA